MIDKIDALGALNIEDHCRWVFSFPLFDRSTVVLFTNLFLIRIAGLEIFQYKLYVSHRGIITDDYVKRNGILVPSTKVIGEFVSDGNNEIIKWESVNVFARSTAKDLQENKTKLQQLFNQMVLEMYARI